MASDPGQRKLSGRIPLEPAAGGLRLSKPACLFLLLLLAFVLLPATLQAANPYFTLSTNKSFAPGIQPKLHLYTHDVDALEFRVYRVQDPEAFAAALQEMHSFGDPSHAWNVSEQVDEKTWIERFHDWKSSVWHAIKQFFRTQFSRTTREAFKTKQASLARRSVIVNAAQFAQVPLLNDKQLVARWRLRVPDTFVSDNQVLPIDGLDRGMYLVEATDGHLKAYTVLLVSQTALITRLVSGQVVTYVADRTSGAPVANASVSMQLGSGPIVRKTSAADGTATFDHAANNTDADTTDGSAQKFWFLARSGQDIALTAPFSYSFTQVSENDSVAYVYTDRPVYRPGNTVHFKGILRNRSGNNLTVPAGVVHMKAVDDADKTLLEKDLTLSALGTVEGDILLPSDAGLGFGRITLTRGQKDESVGSASFRVEEYRKPEYQVQVSVAKPIILQGDSNSATIQARYFFGEPVSHGRVKYRIYRGRHYWWGNPADADDDNSAGDNGDGIDDPGTADDVDGGDQQAEQTGQLDSDGRLTVPIPTRYSDNQRYDTDYIVEAGVTDEAGREITARYRFLATHGSFRIHTQTLSYTVAAGGTASVQVSAVDYSEHPVQTRVHVRLVQPSGGNATGDSDRGRTLTETDVNTGDNGSATATLSVPATANGSIRVIATAETPERRTVEDSDYIWVSGKQSDEDEDSQTQKIRILTDKKSYAPGETAHVTLVNPVADAHVLFTATANAPLLRKLLQVNGTTATIDIPISKDAQPNLTLDAVLIKNDTLYQGRRNVSVPPTQQRLQIAVDPVANVFQPGQAAVYNITATDFAGHPVSAELSFGVVDEAIYSLYPDSSGDIVKQLYPDRAVYPEYDSSLTYYFTGEAGTRSPQLAMRRTRYGARLAQVKPGMDTKGPRIRKDFPDTAYWQPAVRTDSDGHARVSFSYPDSLTTWRATVRGITAASQAGSAVNRVIVRKNVIVRMGQPRFLRKGDNIMVPVIVHNYLPSAEQVQVSLNATGLDMPASPAHAIDLAPRADSTVNYQLHASAIGTATLTAKAIGANDSDALQLSFPVQPDGVKQVLANSGIAVNTSTHQSDLLFPSGTDPAAHRLRISASPSIAGTLFGALDYLTSFPYGCTEQTMSSFLPDLLVSQALTRLGVPLKESPARLHAQVEAGLQKLNDTHHADGGWGWWQEDDSQIFMTAYVVSGLQQAVQAGYPEANTGIDAGVNYLVKQLAQHPRMLPDLRAFVVYALSLHKRNVSTELDTLYKRRADLDAQALAYTGLAMRQAGDQRSGTIADLLESKALVRGEIANWNSARNNLLDVDSDESAAATAFAMKFLLQERPNSPLLPKAAQWLMLQRNEGDWWGSTEDTAFVLYGLTDYVAATQELNADLDVDVRVNGTAVAHRHFSRTDALHGATLDVELDAARLKPEANQIVVTTSGSGRVYWSARGEFYSTAKSAYQSGSMQLNVARDYFKLVPKQDGDHVVYTLQPLTGTAQQGDILAVHLGVSGSPQKYLLLEDPIAAGTEFVRNRSSYAIQGVPNTWTDWFTREEFHDDRAAFFSTTFTQRQDLFYLVQVVNAGSFQISPARVTPMYQPGVQATTDAMHLNVPEVTR